MRKLIDLFKALIRNGLKISPKKCQLFRKKLVYMGHTHENKLALEHKSYKNKLKQVELDRQQWIRNIVRIKIGKRRVKLS